VGKHFTINQMVAKESVRARMDDREVGISYTEFSYMLLQAYDFYHLAEAHGCELQIGGSDQWGNITAGLDLIRKRLGRYAYGLTMPLITKADGTKFGKTESGTIWLDAKRTSVFKFYQFWMQTDDRDVVRYLNYFTLLSVDEIATLAAAHEANPGARTAHQALALEMTTLLHGAAACAEAQSATAILFGGGLEALSEGTFDVLAGEIPTVQAPVGVLAVGWPVLDAVVAAGLATSKGQARKDVEGGGISLNGVRVTSATATLGTQDLLFGRGLLLRKGKRNYALVMEATELG
jgi:tyrosyl-tRNA synthetase